MDLSCIFPAQSWNQPFLQGALIPFIGEWYLEAKSGCGVLTAPGVSLLLGPLRGLGTTCMYTSATELGTTCLYTNTS